MLVLSFDGGVLTSAVQSVAERSGGGVSIRWDNGVPIPCRTRIGIDQLEMHWITLWNGRVQLIRSDEYISGAFECIIILSTIIHN